MDDILSGTSEYNGTCPKCGKLYLWVGDRFGDPMPVCGCPKELESGATSENVPAPGQGWMCPGCGRVYAPWVYKCEHCGPKIVTTSGANAT
jgi:hypothetical protein